MMKYALSEETAKIIIDALAWCNRDWMNSLNWIGTDEEYTMGKIDFLRYCRDRGIEYINKEVSFNGN